MRRLATIIFVAILCAPRGASAHDSPIDHVERVVRMYVDDGRLHVIYRFRIEERQAMLELGRMDVDADGKISETERAEFFAGRAAELARALRAELDGRVLKLEDAGPVELGADLSQTYHLSASLGELRSGRHEGRLADDFSRTHPGPYRYSPRQVERGPARVEVAEAPKVEQGGGDGHPAMIVVRFAVVVVAPNQK